MPLAKTAITLLILLTALAALPLSAQEESIIRSEANAEAVAAVDIDDLAWIAGQWKAENSGGIAEAQWSTPADGAIMGAFRMIMNGKVAFYQFLVLGKQDGEFMVRIKHFNPDLKGWEERDKSTDFKLVDAGENIWYFKGFTFEKHSQDSFTIYVKFKAKEKVYITPFTYARVESLPEGT